MKLIFSSNISWSIYNFRKDLLLSLQAEGFEIHCISKRDGYASKLENLGFHFHNIDIQNNTKNPIKDLRTTLAYYKLYKSISPEIILHNAIKPNIYGTVAAGMLNIPVINNISGLGTLFIRKSFSTTVAKFLYKFSLRYATTIFFQNRYDLQLFLDNSLVGKPKSKIIPGSGVDTRIFKPIKDTRSTKNKFTFLFVGRLLRDKGILELFEAVKLLKEENHDFHLLLLGGLYKDNETSISPKLLDYWKAKDYITYLGATDNVIEIMQKADCIVLPSYREGLSKVLIEASSLALPIITTNVPGCKDVVVDNETGFLCESKNGVDLKEKMLKMLQLPLNVREEMGKKGRERCIKYFDIKIVINKYISEIHSII